MRRTVLLAVCLMPLAMVSTEAQTSMGEKCRIDGENWVNCTWLQLCEALDAQSIKCNEDLGAFHMKAWALTEYDCYEEEAGPGWYLTTFAVRASVAVSINKDAWVDADFDGLATTSEEADDFEGTWGEALLGPGTHGPRDTADPAAIQWDSGENPDRTELGHAEARINATARGAAGDVLLETRTDADIRAVEYACTAGRGSIVKNVSDAV